MGGEADAGPREGESVRLVDVADPLIGGNLAGEE